ncbi:MAG: hydroxymethylbilane synthase [Gallionella sp.]|nr:hydroxymethylbilane synthase [Gallionella sp.]OIO10795.1 MAG: hydroxymethylbilane synthase [Gallionellaceae bacterium CG1_02_60_325]PIR09287.1 MAG: hydroxymethylbilane synthase [Gallionellaceae bacterium CG11_big_fil_rev_8_21_14_0_20_60_62]PIV48228.1 MAG: hydroxymethylbilane synthase [Gallionellaceae bacterium CG02_land_8_20_14_3_00_60_115]PIY05949.1 MAG: hydroxymethylbilane synthase [Gallionellaceae bacterium CG_4_10_14_3_um_filter_60_1069]PJC04729.1 MAG: hydroxymethylbilane synthase [Gall
MTQATFTPPSRLVIASRESALAIWQAEHIRDRLRALYPQTAVEILGMTTQGDQILDVTLSKIGGKGLFVKELETALENGSADLAVHSLKDVPMHLPSGFALACIAEREDPRDAFVSNDYAALQDLPPGSIVGTSSLRRESQLRARFPHLRIEPLRGNVQTRLRKLDEGQYSAIILAAAGLKRLGLGERIRAILSSYDSLPAVGQGALGIETRADRADLKALLAPLHHADTATCVLAERAMSRALAGSCQVPLGGFAEMQEGQLRLRGFVATPDGSRLLRAEQTAAADAPETLGEAVAQDLLQQGAGEILAALNG